MSTTKTPLGLNQWELDEKLKMADFNSDNQIVDQKLRDHDGKLSAVDQKVDTVDDRLTSQMNSIDTRLTDQMEALSDQLGGQMNDLDLRMDDLSQAVFYDAAATYTSGVFTLLGLPDELPPVYTVRFIAPEDYTYGDRIQVGGQVMNVVTLDGGAPQTGAFKAGVVVSMDIHGAGGRAFFQQGGSGSSNTGILPSQTQIEVTPGDASADVTLFNVGGQAYAGTKLVYKQGQDMPQTQTDGQVVDAGKSTKQTLTQLTNNSIYTVRAFAYNPNGEVQTDVNGAVQQFSPTQWATVSALAVGQKVIIPVNGVDRMWIVVHQGLPSSMYDASCNGTWLLMEDILENRRWHTSNVNDYQISDIHSYLNSTFISMLDSNTQKALLSLKIPYYSGGLNATVYSGSNGLSCKSFLLSYPEIGGTYTLNDGAKLDYFLTGAETDASVQARRVAYYNGNAADWWLRTPSNPSEYLVTFVSSAKRLASTGCTMSYGIRPAIVLSPSTPITDDGRIVG